MGTLSTLCRGAKVTFQPLALLCPGVPIRHLVISVNWAYPGYPEYLRVPGTARRSNQSVLKELKKLNPLDVVQSLSLVWLFEAPWAAACQASLSFTIFQGLLKLMPIESMMPSNHLILCHPLLLLPSIFPSIGVFSSESALPIRWPGCIGTSASASVVPESISLKKCSPPPNTFEMPLNRP